MVIQERQDRFVIHPAPYTSPHRQTPPVACPCARWDTSSAAVFLPSKRGETRFVETKRGFNQSPKTRAVLVCVRARYFVVGTAVVVCCEW